MGDEEINIWLDEYINTMGNITVDINDSYYNAISDHNYQDWVYSPSEIHDNITLTGGGEEMLRIDRKGFYVRGVRVKADAKEAEQVYNAFKQWLTWANLSKNSEE